MVASVSTVSYLLSLVLSLALRVASAEEASTSCKTCNEFGIGAICQIQELAALSEVMVNSLSNVRSPHQVDAYIRCQLRGRLESDKLERELDYLNQYRHYIKAAAKSFGIPPQLLQCAILRETAFDAESESSTAAARGMCQITPITQTAIDQIVRNDSSRLSGMWDEAFVDLIQKDLYGFPNENGEAEPPTAFTTNGVHRSQNCIVASALYFRDMLQGLASLTKDSSPEQLIENNSSDPSAYTNLLLILGAAYNSGPQAIRDIVSKTSPAFQLKTMVAKIAKDASGETKRYVESLRRCLTPGDFHPPAGWYDENPNDNERGMPPPECSDELRTQESESRLLSPALWPGDQYFERAPLPRPPSATATP
jgi:hypothetical protein